VPTGLRAPAVIRLPDDDVASREVRLGYAVYGDALQCIVWLFGSGAWDEFGITASLQYSGLSSTKTVFFLLCSDGLSDYDRVEQCWKQKFYHP